MNMDANELGYKGFKDYTARFLKTHGSRIHGTPRLEDGTQTGPRPLQESHGT